MDNVYQPVVLVATVVGLLTLLGASYALVRGSYNQARVKALREDVDDRDKRLKDRDQIIEAHEIKERALTSELEHKKTEIKLLEELVTQRANVESVQLDVAAVLEELKRHHQASEREWGMMNTNMAAILEESRQPDE